MGANNNGIPNCSIAGANWCELETLQHVVTGADGCRPTVSAPPMPLNAVKKLKNLVKVRKVVEAGSTLRVHHVQERGKPRVTTDFKGNSVH